MNHEATAKAETRLNVDQLKEELKKQRRLLEINRKLNSELEPRRLLAVILEAAIEFMEAERAFLILNDGDRREVMVSRDFDGQAVKEPETQFSRSVVESVMKSGEAIVSGRASDDERFSESLSLSSLRVRSLICVPLRIRDSVAGAIYVDNRFSEEAFDETNVKSLEAFADQAAISLHNARLFDENHRIRQRLREHNESLKVEVQTQRVEVARLREALGRESDARVGLKYRYPEILGQSPKIIAVLQLLDRVMNSDYPVLIRGDSGTGKELIARALHRNGNRKDRPFITENFAAIPDSLVESELFGHIKGSFTGADRDKPGLFEVANRGTLFLDEIGDISTAMQKKMLRVLEEGEVRRVGAEKTIGVDVRIISATNKNLKSEIAENRFREDLYYRLKVVEVELPPLRERGDDIPILIQHFLEQMAREEGSPVREIERAAVQTLASYDWPGNIRELKNTIMRLAALGDELITLADVQLALEQGLRTDASSPHVGPLRPLADVEKEHIIRAMNLTDNKPTEAAKLLGISYTTLWRRLKTYGLRNA